MLYERLQQYSSDGLPDMPDLLMIGQPKIDDSLYELEEHWSHIVTDSQVGLIGSRSGQVWGHTPEQRVAASTSRRYSFGLRLAIAQADARPAMPASFR